MQHALEWIEQRALMDMNRALDQEAERLGRVSRAFGSAYASAFTALPPSAIVANRTIGLGLAETADDELLDDLVGVYRASGIQRYFVHLHPDAAPADLEQRLSTKGLESTRAWVKFSRGRELPPEAATDLEVRLATPADAPALGRIAAASFDLGAPGEGVVASIIGRPNWHVFMTAERGEPAGCGALYVEDGIGWLDWGATAPNHRGRNGQSALLRQRILHALDLGCDLLGTCTGEEVPDDPQISYHNILKMSFTPAYTRRNMAPPKPG